MTWLPTEPLKSQECNCAEKLAKVEEVNLILKAKLVAAEIRLEDSQAREKVMRLALEDIKQGCDIPETQDCPIYECHIARKALAATAEREG